MPINILPEVPSFGQIMGRGLGQGLGSGVSKGFEIIREMSKKRAEEEDKAKRFQQILNSTRKNSDANQEENLDTGEEASPDYFSKAKAAISAGLPKEAVDIFSEEGKHERKMAELPKQEYIKSEYKSLPKFLEGIEATEDKIPMADVSIQLAEEAIEDPGKWAAFRDFLADKSGYEGFRSGKGAELTSAIKQYFLGDLSSIKGGRPNQLIEQQLLDAYPRIGRDPISNQKILVGMKMQQDIAKEKVRVARELEEKYLANKGFLPPGFQSIVKRSMKPAVEKIEKDTVKRLGALSKFQKEYERIAKGHLQKGEVLMLSPEGDYEAIPHAQMKQAKESGYIKLKG